MLLTLPIVNGVDIAQIDTLILKTQSISHAMLMEEAAAACTDWLINRHDRKTAFLVLCGAGNNGGDGLAIARRLFMAGYRVRVFSEQGKTGSLQLQQYQRTKKLLPIGHLGEAWFEQRDEVVIDALFGVGLRGSIRAPYGEYIRRINSMQAKECIAIDMPSGLTDDGANADQLVVQADATLSLCVPKHNQLWACHERYIGNLHVLPLASAQTALNAWSASPQWLTSEWITAQHPAQQRFAHKGSFGRVSIAAGGHGMAGAAIMSAAACLRSGTGLSTLHITENLHAAIHAALPEVMLSQEAKPPVNADVLAMGPGWGQSSERERQLTEWLAAPCRARVVDADALNLLAQLPMNLHKLPDNTILTPHPVEFSRLTGEAIPENDDRIQQAREYAMKWDVTVVLKGKYSVIASKEGNVWINPTGNSALAKGGSGDVLTGMIAGYLAQGYNPEVAATMAVYYHGLAADLVIRQKNARAVVARDIVEMLAQLPI
ncbi:NAD(P)H-hydrate dehydratase [Cardiobacteriaceae bacterium TAE3-ERU3]|nr:NAD(P)H-hydrate dehydratase [Cardiobacteriaceae bacterium TAE3-ERU3]